VGDILSWLTEYDIPVAEVGGWRTRRHAGAFTPVGVMVHHTGSENSSMVTIRDGHSRLAGPLAQLYVEQIPHPKVWLISQGKCWHAGSGSPVQLERTQQGLAPLSRAPDPEDGNGNQWYWGIEIEGDTPDDFDDERYQLSVRCTAAILDANGWGPERVVAHKEWTKRKVDPAFNMTVFRDHVADEIEAHDMAQFTEEEVKQLKGLVLGLKKVDSTGYGLRHAVTLVRKERDLPLHTPVEVLTDDDVLKPGDTVTLEKA